MRQSKNKMAVILAVCMLTAAGTIGLTNALLQKNTEVKENVISAGKVDIRLEEPSWDPEKAGHLRPGELIKKDPSVTNTGLTDAKIYMAVQIPTISGYVVDPKTRRKTSVTGTDLFTLMNVSNAWSLITTEKEKDHTTYLYAYTNVLKKEQKTDPLFQAVMIAPYLEGALDPEKNYEINVQAMAIQSELGTQDAKEIYAMYCTQIEHDKQAG